MSNIIILTNYACGGKTSMLPALKTILSSRFQDKFVFTIDEPVRFLLEDVETVAGDYIKPKYDMDFYQRQASFLATSIAQFEIVREFMYNDKFIIICDRFFLDPFIYLHIDTPNEEFREKVEIFTDMLGLFHVELNIDFQFYYLDLPKRDEIIELCFTDETRQATIDINTIREEERKFYEKYCIAIGTKLYKYPHPSDNSYVVYDIADDIISKLK